MAWEQSLNRFGLVHHLWVVLLKHFQKKCMGGQALDFAFGMENPHQRAANSHADAMKQWREACRELWQRRQAMATTQLAARPDPSRVSCGIAGTIPIQEIHTGKS